jgi:hypothetical protein
MIFHKSNFLTVKNDSKDFVGKKMLFAREILDASPEWLA